MQGKKYSLKEVFGFTGGTLFRANGMKVRVVRIGYPGVRELIKLECEGVEGSGWQSCHLTNLWLDAEYEVIGMDGDYEWQENTDTLQEKS